MKLRTVVEKFQKKPDHIATRDFRFYSLLKIVNSVGLMTHFFWIFLFYYLEVLELSFINIASASVFIVAYYLNEKGRFFLSITIGILEVIAHQILCSYYIGIEVGFQYYILIACILPFLLPHGRILLKTFLLILSLLAFIFIIYFISERSAIYQLEITSTLVLGYSNVVLAFAFLGIWGVYFSRAILTTEMKLEQEIKKTGTLLLNIEKKGVELKEKNKAILDSINYSEKIQRSILPPIAEIHQKIPNAFVYFEPKDIIGGDFYWYFTRGKKCYIAAIDCTGHGVPGALMSMTIYSLLNEIMIKEELTDPGEILSLLHKKLSLAMQQQKGDEYSQDGCDATLVRIDLNTKELVFSGAQNDLLIYNGSELKTLQAERQSIGGFSMLGEFESERVFTSQTITISNTDLIILTTDGIPDQLNINDEAFGISEFKGIIEGMYDKNPDDMKSVIESGINKWKKNVQQQDDLLIYGFRLN